jgi:murein DD-endopeptidase MepM/ murein hydrolase activator NlpD
MDAIAYNRRKHRLGKFTDAEVVKLVKFFQEGVGLTKDDIDGKFGSTTRAALDKLAAQVSGPPSRQPELDWDWCEGSKAYPTPNPEVWKDWVYPMPILIGGHQPHISSGFAQYGVGPNKSRPNHWGCDVMYRRHQGDEGPPVRKDGSRWRGGRMPPTHSPGWYCPHGVDIVAPGPGTIWSVNLGTNNNVKIDHHNVPGFGPLCTWYQHMHEIFVEKGDEVEAGEVIGIVGAGSTNLIHLHFEFRNYNLGNKRAQTVVNPEPYLDLFTRRAA